MDSLVHCGHAQTNTKEVEHLFTEKARLMTERQCVAQQLNSVAANKAAGIKMMQTITRISTSLPVLVVSMSPMQG